MIVIDAPEIDEPSHCYRVRTISHPTLGALELEHPGFLCGKLGPPCVQCQDVSEVLCDFPLGEEGRTCDKPLCLACAPEVGVDKNYCAEHMDHGPGLALFPLRKATMEDLKQIAGSLPKQIAGSLPKPPAPRARRLPKAPHPNQRWRVLEPNYQLGHDKLGRAITRWTTESSARSWAAEHGGIVETWDQFVIAWRATYPLKRSIKKPCH